MTLVAVVMISLTQDESTGRPGVTDIVAPLVDPQTYKNLVYFVLAFPLGMVYSFILGFGFLFGLGLSIVLLGLGLLIGLLFVIRALAGFERWLANGLLGVSIDPPADGNTGEGVRSAIVACLAAESTWRGLGFLVLKLWTGIVGVFLLFAFATVASMLSAIVSLPHVIEFGEVNGDPVTWTVETLPEAALAMALGLLAGLVLVHLTNGFAYAARRMARSML